MKIGELAAATATPVETIRYYERAGLLVAPARSGSGNYRRYGEADQQRLAFIRRCRALDMTLDEVRTLLAFIDAPGPDCERVNGLLDEHIGHVAARIAELKRLERQLRELRARCVALGSGAACGILQGLMGGEAPARTHATRGMHPPHDVHGRGGPRRTKRANTRPAAQRR